MPFSLMIYLSASSSLLWWMLWWRKRNRCYRYRICFYLMRCSCSYLHSSSANAFLSYAITYLLIYLLRGISPSNRGWGYTPIYYIITYSSYLLCSTYLSSPNAFLSYDHYSSISCSYRVGVYPLVIGDGDIPLLLMELVLHSSGDHII